MQLAVAGEERERREAVKQAVIALTRIMKEE
jgi:hypothetical protein